MPLCVVSRARPPGRRQCRIAGVHVDGGVRLAGASAPAAAPSCIRSAKQGLAVLASAPVDSDHGERQVRRAGRCGTAKRTAGTRCRPRLPSAEARPANPAPMHADASTAPRDRASARAGATTNRRPPISARPHHDSMRELRVLATNPGVPIPTDSANRPESGCREIRVVGAAHVVLEVGRLLGAPLHLALVQQAAPRRRAPRDAAAPSPAPPVPRRPRPRWHRARRRGCTPYTSAAASRVRLPLR